MANHPNRSRKSRTVTFKIVEGGGLARCDNASTSDLAIRVTGVPADVADVKAMIQLKKVILLPTRGPWVVTWERLADAPQGAILRNCQLSRE